MSMDFNDAEPQGQGAGEPMPEGTVAPVIVNLRGIKTSKADNRVQGLDVEYTVTAGPFKGRKAWGWHGIHGNGSDGHNQMVNITRSYVRGMLESAYGIDPADDSKDAMEGRRLGDWQDLHQIEFVARFSVEKGNEYTDQRTGEVKQGKAKNTLRAVTPDDPDYAGFKPAKKGRTGGAPAKVANGAAQGGQRPAWAG
jgi:hypothetical protein